MASTLAVWRRDSATYSVSSHRAQDAVNVYGLGKIFQVFAAELLHMIALTQAADGFWTDQELTGLGSGCQARRQVGDRAARRKGPARPLRTLEAGRADQGEPRVETHVDSQRRR